MAVAHERASALRTRLDRHTTTLLCAPHASSDLLRTSGALRLLGNAAPRHALSYTDLTSVLTTLERDCRPTAGSGADADCLILLSRFTIELFRTALSSLFDDAHRLAEGIAYWSDVETRSWPAARYLIQTAPLRAYRVVRSASTRIRIPSLRQQSLVSRIGLALHAPSVLPMLFPHLSQTIGGGDDDAGTLSRPSFLAALTPLRLTQQEVRLRRKALQPTLARLETWIGSATGLVSETLLAQPVQASEELVTTVATIAAALCGDLDGPPDPPRDVSAMDIDDLCALLASALADSKRRRRQVDAILSENASPAYVLRAWPYLFLGPPATYLIASRVWNARGTFRAWYQASRETVRGYIVDWVIDPALKILETVRHGDRTMALMGKESLNSDLDSLQRMVADFSREQKGYTDAQVQEIAQRVREGDMTPVLRVWEADIKTPIRSAVAGSLLRTLLIQVQKVKVDVALAMDGIEKMLRSQQLTFAFVGVAPSLLIAFSLERLFVWLLPVRAKSGMGGSKAGRRRAWSAVRAICSMTDSDRTATQDARRDYSFRGRLLLQTEELRSYAVDYSAFGRDTELQAKFLDDVRAIERTAEDQKSGRRAAKRLWRLYSSTLGWDRAL